MGDLIDREKVIEAVKRYGKEAISAGRKILDPVDDIVAISRMNAAKCRKGRRMPNDNHHNSPYPVYCCLRGILRVFLRGLP